MSVSLLIPLSLLGLTYKHLFFWISYPSTSFLVWQICKRSIRPTIFTRRYTLHYESHIQLLDCSYISGCDHVCPAWICGEENAKSQRYHLRATNVESTSSKTLITSSELSTFIAISSLIYTAFVDDEMHDIDIESGSQPLHWRNKIKEKKKQILTGSGNKSTEKKGYSKGTSQRQK
jgi:hypothetical protein